MQTGAETGAGHQRFSPPLRPRERPREGWGRAGRPASVTGLLAFAALSLAGGGGRGLAHHGGSVARLEPSAPRGAAEVRRGTSLESTLAYGYRRFGGLLGRRLGSSRGDASVDIHLVELGLGLGLPTGTQLSANVPVGVARTSDDGRIDERVGLGDLDVVVDQSLLRLLWPKLPVDVVLSTGLSLPTGRYAEADRIRVPELETDPSGGLDLVPNDTRTSLGAGAPALRWGARIVGWPGADVRLVGGATGRIFFAQTPDELRWGEDLELRIGADAAVLEALRLGAGLRWLHHGPDDIPTEDGSRVRLGGRDVIGAVGQVVWTPLLGYAIGLDLHLPLHQEVRAVQVAETASGALWFRAQWQLDPGPSPPKP